MVEGNDGDREYFVLDVWDVLLPSLALDQSPLPDRAVQFWDWGFWKEQQAPRATHGHNKEAGKMPAKSHEPCPLGHWRALLHLCQSGCQRPVNNLYHKVLTLEPSV